MTSLMASIKEEEDKRTECYRKALKDILEHLNEIEPATKKLTKIYFLVKKALGVEDE